MTPAAASLDPDVAVHPPTEEGAPWVVQRPDRSFLRVGADMGRLLRALDGRRDGPMLARHLGAPWTEAHVEKALASAAEMELLAGSPRRSGHTPRKRRRSSGRIRLVPPLTIQFTVLRPERISARIGPLLARVPGPLFLWLPGLLAAGGLVALAFQGDAVARAIGSPVSIWTLLVVFVGTLTITGLHEFGHGLSLARYGGSPSRIGIMLFYLTPVFFCDVTDAWRLPQNRQRVAVAFAGIGTQLALAGSLAVAAGVLGAAGGSAAVRTALLALALSTYLAATLNLIPLVKFDGYIALMSGLDLPQLRANAMTDARRATARVLFGGRRQGREVPRRGWPIPYGIACTIFPIVLILSALALWSDLLGSIGWVGPLLLAALIVYLGYRVLDGGRRMLLEARRAGAGLLRMVTVSVLLVLGAAGGLLIPVPNRVPAGYVCTEGGGYLVLGDGVAPDAVSAGDTVTLREQGLITGRPVGQATVNGERVDRRPVPLQAFYPISDFPITTVPARTRALTGCGQLRPDAPAHGAAVVDAGVRPLGHWLVSRYLAPLVAHP